MAHTAPSCARLCAVGGGGKKPSDTHRLTGFQPDNHCDGNGKQHHQQAERAARGAGGGVGRRPCAGLGIDCTHGRHSLCERVADCCNNAIRAPEADAGSRDGSRAAVGRRKRNRQAVDAGRCDAQPLYDSGHRTGHGYRVGTHGGSFERLRSCYFPMAAAGRKSGCYKEQNDGSHGSERYSAVASKHGQALAAKSRCE